MDRPDSCALEVSVADGKIERIQAAPAGTSGHHNTQGFICNKIGNFDRRVYHPDRILYPQRRVGPKGEARFEQGFVATLFFGWLPLYLPELFPTRVRAAGAGIAYNVGRFATALGVLAAGALFAAMGGSYPKVGAICGLIYLLGLIVIWWAPDTTNRKLKE